MKSTTLQGKAFKYFNCIYNLSVCMLVKGLNRGRTEFAAVRHHHPLLILISPLKCFCSCSKEEEKRASGCLFRCSAAANAAGLILLFGRRVRLFRNADRVFLGQTNTLFCRGTEAACINRHILMLFMFSQGVRELSCSCGVTFGKRLMCMVREREKR